MADELAAARAGFSLLCGRYEGVDHRVREHLVDGELSVGDVVLERGRGGRMPRHRGRRRACCQARWATRRARSPRASAQSGLLEEPQYTRPAEFRGWQVPDVLRSGDHARIDRWRRAQALHRTLRVPSRPGRGPRWAHRSRPAAVGRVPSRSPILCRSPSAARPMLRGSSAP